MPNTSALLSKSATTSGRATVLPCVCVGLSGTRVLWLIQQWGNLALSEVSMRAIRNEVIPGSQMMTEWRAATRFERVTFALGGQTPNAIEAMPEGCTGSWRMPGGFKAPVSFRAIALSPILRSGLCSAFGDTAPD